MVVTGELYEQATQAPSVNELEDHACASSLAVTPNKESSPSGGLLAGAAKLVTNIKKHQSWTRTGAAAEREQCW